MAVWYGKKPLCFEGTHRPGGNPSVSKVGSIEGQWSSHGQGLGWWKAIEEAFAVSLYFWWASTQGTPPSSHAYDWSLWVTGRQWQAKKFSSLSHGEGLEVSSSNNAWKPCPVFPPSLRMLFCSSRWELPITRLSISFWCLGQAECRPEIVPADACAWFYTVMGSWIERLF